MADDPFESLLEFITPLWLSELSSRELRHALASRTLDGIARTSGYAAGAGGRENLQRSMEAKLRELDSKYYVENVRAAMPMFANSRPTTLALGIAQVRLDAQVRRGTEWICVRENLGASARYRITAHLKHELSQLLLPPDISNMLTPLPSPVLCPRCPCPPRPCHPCPRPSSPSTVTRPTPSPHGTCTPPFP